MRLSERYLNLILAANHDILLTRGYISIFNPICFRSASHGIAEGICFQTEITVPEKLDQ